MGLRRSDLRSPHDEQNTLLLFKLRLSGSICNAVDQGIRAIADGFVAARALVAIAVETEFCGQIAAGRMTDPANI